MTEPLKTIRVEPVLLSDLRHHDERVRLAAQQRFAGGYMQDGMSGFGAIAVCQDDNLFDWSLLEENTRFLNEVFSPEGWEKISAAGREKDGQVGTTDLGEEKYGGRKRVNKNRYLHVSTDGKPEVIHSLSAKPAFLRIGHGMFEVAREAAYALERACLQSMGMFERKLTMSPDSFTTYRFLDYPAGGTIEPHVDTSGISVVKFEPGVRARRGACWYKLALGSLTSVADMLEQEPGEQVRELSQEGFIIFLVNLGRTGALWLKGDDTLATEHSVFTPTPRRTFALFVHLDPGATWLQNVHTSRASDYIRAGDLVMDFAREEFETNNVAEPRPASS